MTILITGGAGYIGSHCCLAFLKAGYEVVAFDNLSNSSSESLTRVAQIAGKKIHFERGDICDYNQIELALRNYECTAVIHFAGLKSVAESCKKPLLYYKNNVIGSYNLLTAMNELNIRQVIFSSSATVYGQPETLPYSETHALRPTNPYGQTKLAVEEMLKNVADSSSGWKVGILRYFNPVGAHESGLMGENPTGTPNNLMPFIAQVALGKREKLTIFGNDYETPDGTGVRDYIHVADLVDGHLSAHEKLQNSTSESEVLKLNLGTGKGQSVLEVIRAFEMASNRRISFEIGARRDGDLPSYFANPAKAEFMLAWKARKNLQDMCRDTWNWVSRNPNGY